MLVLDASVTLSWLMPDEHSEYSDAVLKYVGVHGARVPAIWVLEMVNALLVAERGKRLSLTDSSNFFRQLQHMHRTRRLKISDVSLSVGFTKVAELARDHKLTAYDAAYLNLAMIERLPLASIDRELVKAATRGNVQIWH